MCIEQQKDCKKATDEIKSAQTATNRRMTAIENTAQRIENKLDQVLVLLCQQRTHAEPRDNEPSTVERLGVDADAEEITLDTEFLQLSYRKANNCGHFAAIIVPKVFPELFGPMRLRLQYNWEGNKGKQALDEQRKNVLKKMVNQYYPETRVESSWVSCVSRINEVLRRKYIPRAQQLQEIHHVEHTEATDDGENISNELPSYADQMMHQSLDDIATPNFSSTIGPYMQYMNMDVY